MSESMKCVVCYGPKDFRLEDRPIPTLDNEEVLIKVTAAGICAGDAKRYHGAPYFWEERGGKPAFVQPPVILGHEFVGQVVALGPGAGQKYSLKVGDYAVSENILPCWECANCKAGRYNLCIPHNIYGSCPKAQGSMCEYMKFPKGALNHKVPKSIPPWKGAFIEPLACSVHAVNLANIQPQDTVVVSGCGPMGLGMVAAARLKHPKCLIGLDLITWKNEICLKCGADIVINPLKENAIQRVNDLTNNNGCTVYIEATGSPSSVKQGLQMLGFGGRYIQFGVFGKETAVDWSIVSIKEITIIGGHLSPNTYQQAIDMIEKNQIPLEDIITHQLPMDKFLEGIDIVTKGEKSLKVVLLP